MKYFKSSLFFTVIYLILIQKSSAGVLSFLFLTFIAVGGGAVYQGCKDTCDSAIHNTNGQQKIKDTGEGFVFINFLPVNDVADLPVKKDEKYFKAGTVLKDGGSEKFNVPANGTRDIGGSVSAWPWALPTMGLFGR